MNGLIYLCMCIYGIIYQIPDAVMIQASSSNLFFPNFHLNLLTTIRYSKYIQILTNVHFIGKIVCTDVKREILP